MQFIDAKIIEDRVSGQVPIGAIQALSFRRRR